MPTSSALNAARNTLLANLNTLNQTNPLSPATAQLALLSLIADNAGGGGGGGGASTQYEEGDVTAVAPSTGTVMLFRRADGVLKAVQGDNSDRIKVVSEVSNFPATQAISAATLPLPTGAATESTLSALSGKLPTALVSGRLSVDGSGVTQPVSISALPALSTGSNVIGSISNTSFASTQSGTWNIANISGTVSLPTGAATSAKQPTLGTAGTPSADVISVQGVASGTVIAVSQNSNAATATASFATSTTSTTFTIANRLALIVCPTVTEAPTLTLQVTLDGGTTWVSTGVTLATSASTPKTIEADSLAKLSGAFGLTNAFRFSSSASIASATLNIRSITQ